MKKKQNFRLFGGSAPAKDAAPSDDVEAEAEPSDAKVPKPPKTPSKLPPKLTLPPALPLNIPSPTKEEAAATSVSSPSQTSKLPKNGETMVPIITRNEQKESLLKYQALLAAVQRYKKNLFDLGKGAESLAAALEDFSTSKGSQVVDGAISFVLSACSISNHPEMICCADVLRTVQSIRAGATTHEIIAKHSLQLVC